VSSREYTRILDLLEDHAEFEAALHAVRRAMFRREVADARALWAWFCELLLAHLAFEDAHLLPHYEALDGFPPNATPRVFAREHERLRRAVAIALVSEDPIADADHLSRLAGLLEHHDLRERQALKPRLDEILPDHGSTLVGAYARIREAVGPRPLPTGAREPQRPLRSGGSPIQRARRAMAAGDGDAALEGLGQIRVHTHPKASRLRDEACEALGEDDLVTAWDRTYLLSLTLGERPAAR
jgi:hypothetical protein